MDTDVLSAGLARLLAAGHFYVRPHRRYFVLHPNQFHVDEAWIAFRLNDAPISTEADGDFNLVALMDAASCFILGSLLLPVAAVEPSEIEARTLLEKGQAHHQRLPSTLFIADEQPAKLLAIEAESQGITVVRISDDQLNPFIDEARDGFRERFGGSRCQ